LLIGVLALLIGLAATPRAEACKGHPPPPFCGKSLVLAQAAPPVVLLPGGGTFDIPATVYFKLTSFPAGSGICPAGPYTVDVSFTVTCSPTADGTGSIAGAPLSLGYNDFVIPVTLPAGPPRICNVDGVATVTLADGMVVTAVNDSVVCLAEPAPANPALPRLDMELLGPPGSEIQKAHPGDQSVFTYRITNNDQVRSYSGQLAVESVNSSRLPGMSGPQPPGTGVYPISDPGLGDNFPIRFLDDLVEGCVPLPLDPSLPIVPNLIEPLVIPPASFIDIDIFSRHWGMCANGSCSRGKLVLDGLFSDSTQGLACSGFVNAVDTSVPPLYLWPDSGEIAEFPVPPNPALGVLTFTGEPLPALPVQLDMQVLPPQLLVGGLPVLAPPQLFAGIFEPELGRVQTQWQNPGGVMPPGDPFELQLQLELQPPPGVEVEIVELNLVPEAPTGFSDISPFAMGRVGIRLPPVGPDFDGFLEFTLQLSGQAVDDNAERRDLIFDDVQLAISGSATGMNVQLLGQVAPGSGSLLPVLELYHDLTGFLTQGLPAFLFEDGFDSGDTTNWSLTVP